MGLAGFKGGHMKVGQPDTLVRLSPSGGPSQVPPERRTDTFSLYTCPLSGFPVSPPDPTDLPCPPDDELTELLAELLVRLQTSAAPRATAATPEGSTREGGLNLYSPAPLDRAQRLRRRSQVGHGGVS
jgi:hypothetical protein